MKRLLIQLDGLEPGTPRPSVSDEHPPTQTHVDDFVEHPPEDINSRYAAFCLMLFRLPAVMAHSFAAHTKQFTLFCTFEGDRWRVTGASRMGDIWLAKDFNRDTGYDRRVALDHCTDWSATP